MSTTTALTPFVPGMLYRRIHDGLVARYVEDFTGELANLGGGFGTITSLGRSAEVHLAVGKSVDMLERGHWQFLPSFTQERALQVIEHAENAVDKGYDEGSLRTVPLTIEWEPFADLETGVEDSTLFRLYCSPESAAEIKPLLQMRGETIFDEYQSPQGWCIEWRARNA